MFSIIEKVLPDAYEVLLRRNKILKIIDEQAPIGRRLLSKEVDLTERLTRSEVDILKENHLISTSKIGMSLTAEGKKISYQLDHLLRKQTYLVDLEEKLQEILNIKSCNIVSGNLDDNVNVLPKIAERTVNLINQLLGDNEQIIAVMGGTTLNEIANQMDKHLGFNRELLFIPARGGLGDDAMLEANIIAQRMAQRTNGQAMGLYAPAQVHEEIYEELTKEPEIKKVLDLLEKSSLVLYSIGTPIEMAKRRGLDLKTLNLLKERNATAEVFGEFINKEGQVVYSLSTIGLRSSALEDIPYLIAVAGGVKKATAIQSYFKTAPSHTCLVTDEAAASEILDRNNL